MFKITVFLAVFLWPFSSFALESPWKSADYVQVKLSGAVEGVGQEAQIDAALEVQLAKGWHSYWRMPGDGGLAPVFDWSASENVEDVELSWPVPRRYSEEGLNSFGYEDRVAFPLRVKIASPGKAAKLDLKAAIMVCERICVPQDVAVALEIPAAAAVQSRTSALIGRMHDKVPHKGDLPGLRIDSAVIGPDALVVRVYAQRGFDNVDLFVESGDLYLTAAPEITPDKDDARAAFLRIARPESIENLASELMGRTLTLTLTDGAQAMEKDFPL